MLYTVLNVGDKEYKCRLTAKACVDLERRMGQNPLNVFTEIQKSNELPKVEDIIMILHASLQALEHNISLDDTYAIYSEKYGVSMETDKLGAFEVGQSSGEHFDVLVDLLRNYDSKTIQDVRTNLGDKISATSGANTVVAELFAAAVAK